MKEKQLFDTGLYQASEKLLGEPLFFEEAPEPSTIIWENKPIDKRMQFKRNIFFTACIWLVMLGIFWLQSYAMRQQLLNSKNYGDSDCLAIVDLFDGNFSSRDFKLYAAYDMQPTLRGEGAGFYECYCQNFLKELTLEERQDIALCNSYFEDMIKGFATSEGLAYAIVVINYLLRSVNMFFIDYIGYDTESELTAKVQKSVFYT
mmetsp:Transcript_41117/g.30242  ORF Transcript_41117/g.30242 Transcript_41117/m.30242 type:complete len:204 (+) Transcript_41117:115-726(+)